MTAEAAAAAKTWNRSSASESPRWHHDRIRNRTGDAGHEKITGGVDVVLRKLAMDPGWLEMKGSKSILYGSV